MNDGYSVSELDKTRIDTLSGRTLADVSTNLIADKLMRRAAYGSGVMFARKEATDQKDAARLAVLKWFSKEEFPGHLAIITMPGLMWEFERKLIRERYYKTSKLIIIACESDEAIYRAALYQMPANSRGIRMSHCPEFATATFSSDCVQKFYRCRIEKFLLAKENPVDGAWLDFSGPLYISRMKAVMDCWERLIRSRLVITCTTSRYDACTAHAVKAAGGYIEWILSCLPGAVVREITHYADGAGMVQIVLDKEQINASPV
jgi:hypothetical protein